MDTKAKLHISNTSVVYFNQWMGALHTVCWLKSTFWALKKISNTNRKNMWKSAKKRKIQEKVGLLCMPQRSWVHTPWLPVCMSDRNDDDVTILRQVYQCLGATPKWWPTPRSWLTPGENSVIFSFFSRLWWKNMLNDEKYDLTSIWNGTHPLADWNTQQKFLF